MTPCELVQWFKDQLYPNEKMQDPKPISRYNYADGPIGYLGGQIVKSMQDSGFPAKVVEHYRSPIRQTEMFVTGFSKAKPYQSAHQFFLAVDIVHPSKGWNVSREYWDALNRSVRIVAEKYQVHLVHGHDWDGDGIAVPEDPTETFWDAAHVELGEWRFWRDAWPVDEWKRNLANYKREPWKQIAPSASQLATCFSHVLAEVWRDKERHDRSRSPNRGT